MPVARCGAQYRVDDCALAFRSGLDGFMDRGMFSRLGDEELIQAKMQKIAKIDIQVCPSKRANPKVEQREVS